MMKTELGLFLLLALISAITSVTRRTEATISSIDEPASCTRRAPLSTFSTEAPISPAGNQSGARYSTRLRNPRGVAALPLCGTCGGSSVTKSPKAARSVT